MPIDPVTGDFIPSTPEIEKTDTFLIGGIGGRREVPSDAILQFVNQNPVPGEFPTVDVASQAAIPSYTYDNGVSGVGATITFNQKGNVTVNGVPDFATVLLLNGTDPAHNNVFVATTKGDVNTVEIWTVRNDSDEPQELTGEIVFSTSGTVKAGHYYLQTTDNPIIGTDPLVWVDEGKVVPIINQLKTIPGFDATKSQVIGHAANGAIKWIPNNFLTSS